MREYAKNCTTNLLSCLYKYLMKIDENDVNKFHNAMYFIFGVMLEKSEVLFGELQQLKREFETVQETTFY